MESEQLKQLTNNYFKMLEIKIEIVRLEQFVHKWNQVFWMENDENFKWTKVKFFWKWKLIDFRKIPSKNRDFLRIGTTNLRPKEF